MLGWIYNNNNIASETQTVWCTQRQVVGPIRPYIVSAGRFDSAENQSGKEKCFLGSPRSFHIKTT